MTDRQLEGDGTDQLHTAPSPSPRVDLEAALLASEPVVQAGRPDEESAHSRARIVLSVSADADTRHYIRECLRGRGDIHLVEAATPAVAQMLAVHLRPDLSIVDDIAIEAMMPAPVIVLNDERPSVMDKPHHARVWLARPFNAESLLALVDRMLADGER